MKLAKRLLVLVAAMTMVLSLVACGGEKFPQEYSYKVEWSQGVRGELATLKLEEDGSITIEEYNNALNEELTFIGINKNKEETQAPYFQDYVLSELKNIPGIKEYAYKGLKVETTLDLNLNNQITNFITNRIEKL